MSHDDHAGGAAARTGKPDAGNVRRWARKGAIAVGAVVAIGLLLDFAIPADWIHSTPAHPAAQQQAAAAPTQASAASGGYPLSGGCPAFTTDTQLCHVTAQGVWIGLAPGTPARLHICRTPADDSAFASMDYTDSFGATKPYDANAANVESIHFVPKHDIDMTYYLSKDPCPSADSAG